MIGIVGKDYRSLTRSFLPLSSWPARKETLPEKKTLGVSTVYVEQISGFPLPKGKCLLKRTLYGLVQAPLAFYKLCREVYISVGHRQLETEECIFTLRGVYQIWKQCQSWISNWYREEDFDFACGYERNTSSDRVSQDCPHEIAVVIILLDVDNTGIRCDGGRGLPDIECRQFVFATQCLLGQSLHPTNSCKCARLRWRGMRSCIIERASARESQRNGDRQTDTEQGRAGSRGKERKRPTHTKVDRKTDRQRGTSAGSGRKRCAMVERRGKAIVC